MGSNEGTKKTNESEYSKDSILLPYTLDVIETLRGVEEKVRSAYNKQKHSLDLKSMSAKKNIKINIEVGREDAKPKAKTKAKTCFDKLYDIVKKYSQIEKVQFLETHDEISRKLAVVTLILARILRYDKGNLWEVINKQFQDCCNKSSKSHNACQSKKKNKKKQEIRYIVQPFYKFEISKASDKPSIEVSVLIKDHIAIPKDFVASYFGYDTGIDGLNLLMNGGFLLPPDRSAYIAVSGEAGIGKTALAVKLVTSFFQNYAFKNVYYDGEDKTFKDKKLCIDDAEMLSIHYILMEQRKNNIIRLIKDCGLINWKSSNVERKLSDPSEPEMSEQEKIERVIHFVESDTFSPMSMIEEIESIENPKDKRNKALPQKSRNVIVIDSVNAIQDIDINRSEWRELFQSIKSITQKRNTIIFFIVEKKPDQPDLVIEYLSDVVIKLHKVYKAEAYHRILELVESRFQTTFHGKHSFYITNQNSSFIRVYPSTTAMGELIPHRKRVQPAIQSNFLGNVKEVGIKIDGIINFFKYSHLYSNQMQPFFLKNSISMFSGDRGSHKSGVAKKFALSAHRDERWETGAGHIIEMDYREQDENQPWDELITTGFWNSRPKEKAIGLMLYFSENFNENPEEDIIWETHFGKIIIPGCKRPERNYIGCISYIVCSYEVKDLPEEVYLYQVEEFIRTLESFNVYDDIPRNYKKFIEHSTVSLLNRNISKGETINSNNINDKNIWFNPYNTIYTADFIETFDYNNLTSEYWDNFMRREFQILQLYEAINYDRFGSIFEYIKNELEEIKNKIQNKVQNIGVDNDYKSDMGGIKNKIKKINKFDNDLKKNRISIKNAKEIDCKNLNKTIDEFLGSINTCIDYIKEIVQNIIEREVAVNKKYEKSRAIEKVKKIIGMLELLSHKADFLRRIFIFKNLVLPKINSTSRKNPESNECGEWIGKLFNVKLLQGGMIENGETNGSKKFNEKAIDYKDVERIKVSRMILDDAENLDNVFNSLDPRKYISTLAHLCLAREVTLGIVNTRTKNEISEVDKVCNAVSDNAFQFDKYFFKGELYTAFHITRSAASCHNNMLYYIVKRDDGLLQLKNAFSLFSDFDKLNPQPINIRLFLPDLSKELSKSMFRLLISRDRYLSEIQKGTSIKPSTESVSGHDANQSKEDASSNEYFEIAPKQIDYSDQFKISSPGLQTSYKPQEKFSSIFKDWHDYLKDTITYSLAHPRVEVFTANDPFTDISIILEDESVKDAITILCLPGYMMDLYERNLASISDYVHFVGSEGNTPVYVELQNNEKPESLKDKWINFNHSFSGNEANNHKLIKFGNNFHFLQKTTIRIPKVKKDEKAKGNEGKVSEKNPYKHKWIIPNILFNPAIARDEKTNKIIKKKYKDEEYLDIKGYPYYIDPRVNLVISRKKNKEAHKNIKKSKKKENEPDYFIHNTSHDYVTLFFEIWFELAVEKFGAILTCNSYQADKKTAGEKKHSEENIEGSKVQTPDNQNAAPSTSRDGCCNEKCCFCFFEQASKANNDTNLRTLIEEVAETYIKLVKKSVEYNKTGFMNKLKMLNDDIIENNNSPDKIVLREWYSSAQQKLKTMEPLLANLEQGFDIKLEIPDCFLYTTWYLAIPVNSPRKDTASEIIIKMTAPHDLANLQIAGVGLQLSDSFYSDKNIFKSYPEYKYFEVKQAMEALVGSTESNPNDGDCTPPKINSIDKLKMGVPIASIHCYFEHISLLGGILADFYKYYKNILSTGKNDDNSDNYKKELTDKLIAFSEYFKSWQRHETKRCSSCYMTTLFCNRKNSWGKKTSESDNRLKEVQ